MDMSFANQALASEYLTTEGADLERRVYRVPSILDRQIASLKLTAMGIEIDTLTEEQERYLSSWHLGT
jgi:adenosylhomocysteinase